MQKRQTRWNGRLLSCWLWCMHTDPSWDGHADAPGCHYCCCDSLQASAGSRAQLKDLSQQVEQQRDMFTRRVRDLEAKLAAATAAAAGRVSSSGASASSSRRASTAGRGTVRKASDSTPSRRVSAHTSAEAVGQQHQLDENAAAAAAAAEAPSDAAADAAASPLDQLSGSALLRLRDRQVAALSAQLDERTSQVRRG